MKSRIKAVLFDYGGTLATFDFPRDCLLGILRDFRPRLEVEIGSRAPTAEQLVEAVLEKVERDLVLLQGDDEVGDYLAFYAARWRAAGYNVSDELLYQILDAEQRCWDMVVHIEPSVIRLLDRLRARGLRAAVVSNAPFPPQMMQRQVAGNGLAEHVDTVLFSSEIGKRKPAPAIYLEALSRVRANPGEALFVGDRLLEDYEGPRRLGMHAVLYNPAADPPPGIRAIRNLEEVEVLV